MTTLNKWNYQLEWTRNTLQFIRKHLLLIFVLGLIAGLGRAAQLRAFGTVAPWMDVVLEIIIQTARILIFFFSLGLTNVKKGLSRFFKIFSPKTTHLQNWKTAWITLRTQWLAVILNMAVFLLIALLFNLLIDHIAYETCLYTTLRRDGIISEYTSEWSVILFFKNISVIPFTLVFNATLLLWLVKRLPKQLQQT